MKQSIRCLQALYVATFLIALLAACGKPAEPPRPVPETAKPATETPPPTPERVAPRPVAPPAHPAVSAASSTKEILIDLTRWDAASAAARRAAAEEVARHFPDFALLRMETFSCSDQSHEVGIFRQQKSGIEFTLVPVGTFVMGSPDDKFWGHDGGMTQHRVTLTRPYFIARTETTQADWKTAMGTEPAHHDGAEFPVRDASWTEANAFCEKLGLELPTEAQWDYACRSGTKGRFCCGDRESYVYDYAWYEANSDKRVHPVGQKWSNAFGLFDMYGNVEELCNDWDSNYYSTDATTDPVGPTEAEAASLMRILRGGNRTTGPFGSSGRRAAMPDQKSGAQGFRAAKTLRLP